MVHTTFTWGGSEIKKARLREAGLWALDPPSYFSCCQQPLAPGGTAGQPLNAESGSGSTFKTLKPTAGGADPAVRRKGDITGSSSGGGGSAASDQQVDALLAVDKLGDNSADAVVMSRPHNGRSGFLTYDNNVASAVAAAAAAHLQRKGGLAL